MRKVINFTVSAASPPKFFWKLFGYETYEEYLNNQHMIYVDENGNYECITCNDKECPCLKDQSNDPTTSPRSY